MQRCPEAARTVPLPVRMLQALAEFPDGARVWAFIQLLSRLVYLHVYVASDAGEAGEAKSLFSKLFWFIPKA